MGKSTDQMSDAGDVGERLSTKALRFLTSMPKSARLAAFLTMAAILPACGENAAQTAQEQPVASSAPTLVVDESDQAETDFWECLEEARTRFGRATADDAKRCRWQRLTKEKPPQ